MRTVALFSALVAMLVIGVFMLQDKQLHDTSLKQGQANAERLIHILNDHVKFSLLSVELTLQRAVERQYFNALFGGNLRQDMAYNFQRWLKETPHISSLIMTDNKGEIQLISKKQGYYYDFREGDLIDREVFFAQHQTSKDTDLLLSYVQMHVSASSVMIMSRRITLLDGSFGGVIMATIDLEYLKNFFRSVEIGDKNQLSMILGDETLFVISTNEQELSQFYKAVNWVPESEKLIDVVQLDKGVAEPFRIVAYQSLQHLPIKVWLAIHKDDIFETVYTHRMNYLIFSVIFIMFVTVVFFFIKFLSEQIAFVQESEKTAILASQAKSDFLAKMSHELRTPLNAIIGFSEMMNSGYFGTLNDKQEERIRDINLCGNHLLELINDILDFSKGEAGKLTLQEEDVSIEHIIGKALRIINPRAKSESIKIEDKSLSYSPFVRVDARKVQQILLNLLSNAVKFTPSGGTVSLVTKKDAAGDFVLSVIDNGIGIAPDNINKALSVFGQVHDNKNHEGTGLGLPLCKMFAELHGGRLVLESKEGEGTTVSLVLPKERIIQDMMAIAETRESQKLEAI